MRHGEAVPDGEFDEARHLTSRGRADAKKCALHLSEALLRETPRPRIALAVSSHLVRAVQTAELVMSALGPLGSIEITDWVEADPSLAPDGSPSAALSRLERRFERLGEGYLLVVCHEPIIRGIAANLVKRTSFAPFVTAGCACFQDGVERFFVGPEGRVR